MGAGQPYMYDNVRPDSSRIPYNSFDPRAVSRASFAPSAPRPKPDGPLVSFNQHPDSYLVLPYGGNTTKPMNPSIKNRITQTRVVQLILRCLELIGALGLLAIMIMIKNIDATTVWILRIAPGIAILHTVYGIYHLGRKASGRTPGSSGSYHLFSASFDLCLIPFYAYGGLTTATQYKLAIQGTDLAGEWDTLLAAGQILIPKLAGYSFLCSVISGGLHLISLGLSLWLAIIFRKIVKMPPDMNPLEDNLTSRHSHKRNKSSISVATTMTEKRSSDPFESRRESTGPYENLSRPPTIPFLQTRTKSTDSFTTYRSTPPGSRDSHVDLPNRQYLVGSRSNSPRVSIQGQKNPTSMRFPPTPRKGPTYTEVSLSDNDTVSISSEDRQLELQIGNISEAWFTADSLPRIRSSLNSTPVSRNSPSPTKKTGYASYQPVRQHHDDDNENDDISSQSHVSSNANPLRANPVTPRVPNHPTQRLPVQNAKSNANSKALAEVSINRSSSSNYSGDLGDEPLEREDVRKPDVKKSWGPADNFKARYYGELRAATPPIMIATGNGRHVSSGTDFAGQPQLGAGSNIKDRRDVSGKKAEEGRSGAAGSGMAWGTRYRKASSNLGDYTI